MARPEGVRLSGGGLSGRTAFVSGSGRGIGRAIVLELARRGCAVVVNGSSSRDACEETANMVRDAGVEALVAMGDVSRPADVAGIARSALDRFGAVDILVNNAAIRPHKPFLETSEEDWRVVMGLDLDASFHTSRALLPGMVERRWGRIVNITGMKAIRGYVEGAPISAAKHGLWGLTKALARELGRHGVTVNAVSPGPIRRAGGDDAGEDVAAAIPVGHRGEPEDVASLVGFLASPEGRFVTGQMIAANGGAET